MSTFLNVIYIFILFCESILIILIFYFFFYWDYWYFSLLESYRFDAYLKHSITANFISQISHNTTGHDAVDASQLRRLTENQDRQMCQTYPECKHRQAKQAGQTRTGRSVIRLRADKLRATYYESRSSKAFILVLVHGKD